MGDPLRPPAQKNPRPAAASARARPLGCAQYAGKRLCSKAVGPRPPASPPPKNLLSGPAGGHRIRRAPCGFGRARGRPHALGRPGRPVRLTVPEPWGVGVFGAERTTSARHGGSCSTHDEWWAVCPPADRISPPPAPASVRPTPLCHAQSQTRAVVLSLDPLPPAAESPSNGRALRPRRQFQPYNTRSTLWRSPRWAWRVCRHYSCAVCRCFRCDFPPSLPA